MSNQPPANAAAVASLPVNQIVASPTNPRKRFDEAYIADLAESIKSVGLIQPITVRPNPDDTGGLWSYQLVVGECRWRAAMAAGLKDIPAFWRDLDDKQVLEIQVIENLQRRDVHAIEEAEGFQQLVSRHGYQVDQIAARIGKSKGYVYARMKLTALCTEARDDFYVGKLDASTALLVARIQGEALQKKALKAITSGYNGLPLSYRDAKHYIRNHFTISLTEAIFDLTDADLLPEAGACATCPQRSGNNPELCVDIDSVDVCTDTACFDRKCQARRDQLIANAEARKIPILRGDTAREVAPQLREWSIDRDHYVPLDDLADGDAEGRTWRQILGDKAPVAALIELGDSDANKKILELAEPTALAKALKKAGWTPEPSSSSKPGESAEELAEREARQKAEEADCQAQHLAREAEKERRTALLQAVLAALNHATPAQTLVALQEALIGMLRREFDFDGIETELLKDHGHTIPEDWTNEVELPRAITFLRSLTGARLTALTLDLLGEIIPDGAWEPGTPAATLDPLAEILGVTPTTQAAQAETTPKPKKAKGKTAAAETTTPLAPAWPFPTGSRP